MIINEIFQRQNISSGSSLIILTCQQMLGDEKPQNIFQEIQEVFETKKEMRKDDHLFYNLHDGKMMYNFTQHSLFNRKYNSFLLCTCNRGASVMDSNHVYKMITYKEQIKKYNDFVKVLPFIKCMDWDSINPLVHKTSPLHNSSMTSTSFWFMICNQFFPRWSKDCMSEMLNKVFGEKSKAGKPQKSGNQNTNILEKDS